MIVHLPRIIIVRVNKPVPIKQFFYPINGSDLSFNRYIFIIGTIPVDFPVKYPLKVKMRDDFIRLPKPLICPYHQANILTACPGLDVVLYCLEHGYIWLATQYGKTVFGAEQLDCLIRFYHTHIDMGQRLVCCPFYCRKALTIHVYSLSDIREKITY